MALSAVACCFQFQSFLKLIVKNIFHCLFLRRCDSPLIIEINTGKKWNIIKINYTPSHYMDLSKQISWEMPKMFFSFFDKTPSKQKNEYLNNIFPSFRKCRVKAFLNFHFTLQNLPLLCFIVFQLDKYLHHRQLFTFRISLVRELFLSRYLL